MVDDLLAVRKCGFDSTETNVTINTLIEIKKLQFHIPNPEKKSKCHYLHVGKINHHCPGMKVHGHRAEKVEEAVYLGDIIRQIHQTKFFETQWKCPVKDDWTSQVQKDIEDL